MGCPVQNRIEQIQAMPQVDLQTRHFFGGGVCVKRMELPAGAIAISHKHKYDHLSIIGEGRAIVRVQGHDRTVRAGDCITILAGLNHEIEAVEDVTWYCIHATDETDETKIDRVLIEEDKKCL